MRQTKRYLKRITIFPTIVIACGLCIVLVGCSGGDEPKRYEVSGTVTYNGLPVHGGRILFTPKEDAGGGPATVADIADGRFRTRTGKGAIAGPHEVTIYGEDGTTATETHDNSLFPPYRTKVEIATDGTELALKVPRTVH